MTDTQGVQAGSDIKEGKALMTHHVYSWTAACQNASHFPTHQTCSSLPNLLSTVFLKTTGTFRLALCSSSSGHIPKETGKYSINLCLSKLRSPLLWDVDITKPKLHLPPHLQEHLLPSSLESQGRGHTKLSLLPKLGRSCASSVHTEQINSVNYSKSYEREEAQSWWILKLRPSHLMQNTGCHHSTPLWSCTAGPESEAEMFEFFNNNKKNCFEKRYFFASMIQDNHPLCLFPQYHHSGKMQGGGRE